MAQNKRQLIKAVIASFVAVSLVGIFMTIGHIEDVTISEKMIQEKISENIPIEKNGIKVSDLTLYLENKEIQLFVNAEGSKFKQTFTLQASAKGVPSYSEGSFYFTPSALEIKSFKVNGGNLAEKTSRFISKWVDAPKINDNKDEIGETLESWAIGSVEKTAAFALQRIPVYTLPDDFKGNFARIALESVEVEGNNLVAHLSVWKIGKTIFFFLFILLAAVGLTIGMIRNPAAFTTIVAVDILS